MVGRPTDLVGENRQSLGFAVLTLELLEEVLTLGVLAEEQDGGLRESPLEMNVSDLAAAVPQALAGGLLRALDEARIRGEVLDAGEAVNVVDLIEDRQRQDLADAGHRFEMEEARGVVLFDGTDDVPFELTDLPVVDLDESEVGLDALADARIDELLGDAVAVGAVSSAWAQLGCTDGGCSERERGVHRAF